MADLSSIFNQFSSTMSPGGFGGSFGFGSSPGFGTINPLTAVGFLGSQEAKAQIEAQQPALDFQREQFKQQDARRQQLYDLLGLSSLGSGGLLGQNFFQSILGGTPSSLVGGVANAAAPLTSGITGPPRPSSPGFPDAPGGGGGGDLFNQIIGGRQALGQDILGDLAGYGNSQRASIGRQAGNLRGSALANLESRGLGGSNLAGAEMERAARFEQAGLGDLEDKLISQRVGAKQQIGEGIFGSAEQELQRRLAQRGQGFDLLGSIFGSALGVL